MAAIPTSLISVSELYTLNDNSSKLTDYEELT